MAATPVGVLSVVGTLAVAAGWSIVRVRRVSVWLVMGIAMAVLGSLAALSGVVRAASTLDPWIAAGIGVGAGLALYVATAIFMAVAIRWPVLARHTASIYDQRAGLSLPAALAIATLVVAPGEELFWRGVVQSALAPSLGLPGSALAAWGAYVAANAAAWSIPIALAAAVGGGAWSALAWWTGGIAASIACHAVWTGLMILRPPVPRRAR